MSGQTEHKSIAPFLASVALATWSRIEAHHKLYSREFGPIVSTRSSSFDLLAQLPFSRPLIDGKASNATW